MFLDIDGGIFNCSDCLCESIGIIRDSSLIVMEVDLRSQEERKRTLKYFINSKQIEYYFSYLPSKVRFEVCYYIIFPYITLNSIT